MSIYSFNKLLNAEFIGSVTEILLTWTENRLHPVLLVGAVGELLALQADTHVLRIGTVLVLYVQLIANTLEVATIYLYARLVGKHLHEDTGLGAIE